jgi:hypothetical protein
MTQSTLVSNLRSTAAVVRRDLGDLVKTHGREPELGLDERERKAVADLKRDGFAVIEGFWPRERALELRDRLEQYLEPEESRDFESGAYVRFWDNRAHDEGVRRLYHVDNEIPELAEFRGDPSIMRIVHAYYGFRMHSGVLVFQHNTKSNANTRYYHVDVFSKEFKSFLYLDDVDTGNGPFAYLRGTHRSHLRRLKKQIVGNKEGAETSFYERDLGPLLEREVAITGSAGTLILADVRGFHRGTPQTDRSRSVLVNYMYRHEGDLFLDVEK